VDQQLTLGGNRHEQDSLTTWMKDSGKPLKRKCARILLKKMQNPVIWGPGCCIEMQMRLSFVQYRLLKLHTYPDDNDNLA